MHARYPLCLALGLSALCGPAGALTLDFPGEAAETAARVERLTSYLLPVGPFAAGGIETLRIEGALDQRAVRIPAAGPSTLAVLQPLRDQLTRAGFAVLFECEAVQCGGFDFRYGTAVLPEPEMHVDLGDFRYLAAQRQTDAGQEWVSLIVSRAQETGFVQITRAGHIPVQDAGLPEAGAPVVQLPADSPPVAEGAGAGAPTTADAPRPVEGAAAGADGGAVPVAVAVPVAGSLAERLASGGAQVLPDLVFASGAGTLSDGSFASLMELAAFLQANPGARVMLVGHTDASGALEANIALSRARARSVRQRLLTEFDIPERQIEADGVGYLSPRAPNDTEAGRLANRRVEVMLLGTGSGAD